MRMLLADLKTYALEVYGPEGADTLLWSHDSDQPFSPMGCGDLLIIPEAPGAQADRPYRIKAIEHVIWKPPEGVRYVTPVTVGWADAETPAQA